MNDYMDNESDSPVKSKGEDSESSDSEQPENSDTSAEGPEEEAEVRADNTDKEGEDTASEDPFAQLPRPDLPALRIRMFNVSCVFYVVMGLVGIFWMDGQGIVQSRLSINGMEGDVTNSLVMGTAVAGVVFLFGAVVRRVSEWAVSFEEEFAPLVNVFSYAQVPVLAFVSAAGEELFFRGALQEGIGLFAAALLFGVIHFPWKKIMIPWPVFAFVLGLVFGYIVEWTGSLYGPFLGHFLINLVNITLIKHRHPMEPDDIIDELMSG